MKRVFFVKVSEISLQVFFEVRAIKTKKNPSDLQLPAFIKNIK